MKSNRSASERCERHFHQISKALDCWTGSQDADSAVQWRSDAEKNLLLQIPGWKEETVKNRAFHSWQQTLKSNDERAMNSLCTLQSTSLSLQQKVNKVATELSCTPTPTGVADALAKRLLHTRDDTGEACLGKYMCRLCDFNSLEEKRLQEHIEEAHAHSEEGNWLAATCWSASNSLDFSSVCLVGLCKYVA